MALLTGLAAYWKFDESSGDASDASGSGNTLTNTNICTYGSGALNNAVTSNGSTQYMTIPNASQSASLHQGGDWTISWWMKLTAAMATTEGAGPVVWSNNNSAQDASYVQMWQPGGSETRLSVRIRQDASTLETLYLSTGTLTTHMSTGTWYHVAITVNFASSRVRVYENGTQVGADITTTMTTQMAQTGPLTIFAYRAGASNFFNGSFDETGWWTRELSASEISQLYNSGTPLPFSSFGAGTAKPISNLLLMGV